MKRFFFILLVGLILFQSIGFTTPSAHSFTFKGNQFLLDNKPFRIFSGEMHYCRIPQLYWKDRFKRAKAMGLNTICTYVFWNIHEPRPGDFRFNGNLDVAQFIKQAQEEGLWVILRPGPYVCSEWDFGGLPSWLLKDPLMKVRCMYPPYLDAARKYLLRLGQELKDLQCNRGGPIISIQVENEYGSYGNDKQYMQWVENTLREAGFDIQFTTSDGAADFLLQSGALPNALPVVNFGSGAPNDFAELDKFRKDIPHMCGEYWCGWFTQWGHKEFGHSDIEAQKKEVQWMLEHDKSFNFYMVHGGTNFAFYAGANFYDQKYYADITSYDYGSPITEDGNYTQAYYNYRELLSKYLPKGKKLPPIPPQLPSIEIPSITLNQCAPLFQNIGIPIKSVQPRPMEYYDQDYGYILYRTRLVGPKNGKIVLQDVHDYAQIYLDGKYIGKIDRRNNENSIELPETQSKEPLLDILVEAMGRINFGSKLLDPKGITQCVTLRGVTLMNWEVFTLPMNDSFMQKIIYSQGTKIEGPGFFKGSFQLKETGDTFLDLRAWKKGVVWINGINLGRYWVTEGPQYDLYVPGCWLKKGMNEIIIFDIQQKEAAGLNARTTRPLSKE